MDKIPRGRLLFRRKMFSEGGHKRVCQPRFKAGRGKFYLLYDGIFLLDCIVYIKLLVCCEYVCFGELMFKILLINEISVRFIRMLQKCFALKQRGFHNYGSFEY